MVKTRQKKESKFKSTLDFFKQNLQDIVVEEKYLEDPIGGLEPIGDTGLYRTPDEPADPTDCDRYPNSIYCGENPFTRTPIGIEAEIVVNKCDIGIKLTPTLGFVILPEFNLVYRKQECREPKKPPIKYKDVVLPAGRGWYQANNYELGNTQIYAIQILSVEQIPGAYYVNPLYNFNNFIYGFRYSAWKIKYLDCKGRVRYWNNASKRMRFSLVEPPVNYQLNVVREYLGAATLETFQDPDYIALGFSNFGITEPETDNGADYNAYPPEFITFTDVLLIDNTRVPYYLSTLYDVNDVPSYCSSFQFPPPPKEKCCMACCPPKDDTLTKLLLKEVRKLSEKVVKLSEVVGIDEFPASVPESFISKDEGFIGNLIPNENKQIPNLTQFLLWYVERFDEIMGQWEVPIEIKDSDPSKPGDQPLGVRLPNIAEAIGEMFTLAFQTNLNSEVLLNFAVRTAAENMTDKQQNFITYKLLQSLTDWVGYRQKETKEKMPMLYTLGKTKYDEILKESEIEVPCIEFDDKFGLEADLMRFREGISILQAVHKKKVDPTGDIKGQILKYLLDTYAATKKVNGDDEDDMDKFIQQVEEGFGQVPGVTDPLKPYGRDYTQRPRIRDLTKLQPPTEQ